MTEEKTKIKSIHSHIHKYWRSWFPKLLSYKSFVARLNHLSDCFPVLVKLLLESADKTGIQIDQNVIDSMPIITCSAKGLVVHCFGKFAAAITFWVF